MKAQVRGWKKRWSDNLEREYFQMFLKAEDSSNLVVYLDPKNRNYFQWHALIRKNQWIDGIKLLKEGVVDADSQVTAVPDPQQPELF